MPAFFAVLCLIDHVDYLRDEKCSLNRINSSSTFVFLEKKKKRKWGERYHFTDEIISAPRKIVTSLVSTFTAHYVGLWPTYFPELPLSSPMPSFDGRAVQYPTLKNLRDYLSWRQADCTETADDKLKRAEFVLNLLKGHINNLYNTTFWALQQQGGRSATEAEKELKVSLYIACVHALVQLLKLFPFLLRFVRVP